MRFRSESRSRGRGEVGFRTISALHYHDEYSGSGLDRDSGRPGWASHPSDRKWDPPDRKLLSVHQPTGMDRDQLRACVSERMAVRGQNQSSVNYDGINGKEFKTRDSG